MFTPVRGYDRQQHEHAWESRDYSQLVEEAELAKGRITRVEIPPITPWGILVVEPADMD